MNIRQVEFLSLRNNNIVGDRAALYTFPFMTNLTVLDLGCQNVWPRHDDYEYPKNIPKLGNKKVSDIEFKYETNIYTLPKLKILRFYNFSGYISSAKVPDICWANNQLEELDMSFINFSEIIGTLKCLSRLKYLNMRGITVNKMDDFTGSFAVSPSIFDRSTHCR